MKKLEVEIFSDAVNNAVIRLPGRAFPGVLIQGDSLKSLYNLVEELREEAQKPNSEEVLELAEEILELLGARLKIYEDALKAYNIKPPYE